MGAAQDERARSGGAHGGLEAHVSLAQAGFCAGHDLVVIKGQRGEILQIEPPCISGITGGLWPPVLLILGA